MTLLILGLALWVVVHTFKRIAPGPRAALGNAGKPVAAVLLLTSVVLMVLGYRAADGAVYWGPSPALVGINNLLMILAVYLYAADGAKTWLARKVRHPQLTAVKTWAVAHLLVNGDLASFVLFGGLLAWAVVSVILINRAQPVWTPPAPRPVKKEFVAVAATVVVVVGLMLIHNWLGVRPWG